MSFSFLSKLNPRQREAVVTTEGPLQIIAVAGSGKTTVLVNRVAFLVESGVEPEQILLLTFTKKAAANMLQRAAKLANERCKQVYAKTFHSFYNDMLHHYGRFIGMKQDFNVLTDGDEVDRLNYVKAAHTNYKELQGFPPSKVLIEMFSASINKNIPLERIIEDYAFDQFTQEILHLRELLSAYKLEKNELSYDDLMLQMYELLQNKTARNIIQRKFRYIMVDEYQDTNALQEKILQLCVNEKNNIAVVGDDYQSIYAFRGSEVEHIVSFSKRVPNCKTVTIDTNYRSTDNILSVANRVMKIHANFGIPKQMRGTDQQGESVNLILVETESDEAQDIFNHIIDAHENGVPYSEIAVLARSSRELNYLDKLLMSNQIPYEKLGGVKFFEHDAVKDMLALLRCVSNPLDTIAWFRILTLIPDIGPKTGQVISSGCNDPDFLLNKEYRKKKYGNYLSILHNLVKNARLEPDFQKLYDLLFNYYIDLRQTVITNRKVHDESQRTVYQMELKTDIQLCQDLKELTTQYNSIPEFLNSLLLDEVSAEIPDEHVTISTVHSAKGLEWEHVYILNCVNERFPSPKSAPQTKEDEEELRCFYVAITRAKKRLYLYEPELIISNSGTIPTTPSRYLFGAGDLLKRIELRTDEIPHKSTLQFEFRPTSGHFSLPNDFFVKGICETEEWKRIKDKICSCGVCSTCGKPTPSDQLELHARFSYEEYLLEQKIQDLLPVCELCHKTIHMNEIYDEQEVERLRAHYCKVNHLSEKEERIDEAQAFRLLSIRDNMKWKPAPFFNVLQQYQSVKTSRQRIYINCPYWEKDEAKSCGAKWDRDIKKWYFTDPADTPKFQKWLILESLLPIN